MAHPGNIRPAYIGPSRKGSLAKPGKVRCRIDIAVRPATTVTAKAVLDPQSDLSTVVAGLTRIGGIDEHRSNAGPSRLVGDEILQLPEGPAMQSRPTFAENQLRLLRL